MSSEKSEVKSENQSVKFIDKQAVSGHAQTDRQTDSIV